MFKRGMKMGEKMQGKMEAMRDIGWMATTVQRKRTPRTP